MKQLIFLLALCGSAFSQPQERQIIEPVGTNLPAQKIGPNDLIALAVYNSPELSGRIRVGADGLIRLPMLSRRIQAVGMMPDELEAAIAEALKAEGLIVDPVVSVAVTEYHSRPISVAGAVRMPLTFQAAGTLTLLEAITRAGGLSAEAGSEILVSRNQSGPGGPPSQLVQRIPVKGLIDAADPAMNLTLVGGEEIRIPEVGKVFVVGNVKRPGVYPVQENSQTTVLTVLSLAQGLAPYANKQAFIYRRESGPGPKKQIPIELKNIMKREAPDATLMANDILYIPDNSGRRLGLATLEKILMFGMGASTALIYTAH